MDSVHVPILVEPIREALLQPFLALSETEDPHWLIDCTLGGGGHCGVFLQAFASDPRLQRHRILAIDQDLEAVRRGQLRFAKEIAAGRLEIRQGRFGESESWAKERPTLALLADLGFSSDQLEDSGRGFSFQMEGPLDMRLDPSRGISCRELLMQISERELEVILREWGEERYYKRISSAIVEQRRRGQKFETTQTLVQVIVRALPANARHGRIHAATRSFQALRIAVNEELTELDHLLERTLMGVKAGGRIAIIAFHSLEDRRVKVRFKDRSHFRPLAKKAIQADDVEKARNPRSRSAKLRIVEVV